MIIPPTELPKILKDLSEIIHNVHTISGKEKPADWLGKPWACHQLSEHAKGEFLVFIDADVWLEEDAISKAVSSLRDSDTITVWPKQRVVTFWEKMIIPMIYLGLIHFTAGQICREKSPLAT
ncbi:glycosyltransferase [Rhodohalobacter sp.]|uniref:glycosyltransferase n=1 Tax=Rhodohalobacter sp. TaxID=1974210 RepID=UPI002ACE3A61|nr:glycosyltransferase [Rhodohalobacter sp.]MDZ7756024.1 glycosyltransferase [Rhodohalobacter sp.]